MIKTAKKTGVLYLVKELTHENFYDLKPLAIVNYTANDDGEKLKWADIKIVRIDKRNKNKIFYKTSYQENEFKSVTTLTTLRKRQQNSNLILKNLYTHKLSIP